MNKRGYLDPGTGGYLVTSIWPTIATFFAVFFSAVGAFFVRYFIKPIKKFFKDKKKVLASVLIILLLTSLIIITFFLINKENFAGNSIKNNNSKSNNQVTNLALTPSGELKKGMYLYDLNSTYPGYIMIENKLLDKDGKIIKQFPSNTGMGVIQPDGTYVALKSEKKNGTNTNSLAKYSFDGTLIWEVHDVKPHHKISITNENTILAITKEPHEYLGKVVDFDVILEFDQQGNLIDQWSTWKNLKYIQTFHNPLEMTNYNAMDYPVPNGDTSSSPNITSIWGGNYDYYHMNSVEEVPNNSNSKYEVEQDGKMIKPFQEGNWIFNFRHGSMIFILDKDTKKIVWHVTQFDIDGELQGQHDSSVLPDGNILIFENGRYRNWSRVIELNPITKKIEWQYDAPNFYSERRGDVSKMPNGNYLISDSVIGRLLEINSNGKILWEYFNPKTIKKDGILKNQEIFQLKKYSKNFIDSFLENSSAENLINS